MNPPNDVKFPDSVAPVTEAWWKNEAARIPASRLREQVEALKRHLQDRFARMAAEALDAIDKEKLEKAGFGELIRGASLAAQNAGITSPNVQEYCREIILAKYSIQANKEETKDGALMSPISN